MNKRRVLTFSASVVFVMMLGSSVRADSVHFPPGLQKLNLPDSVSLSLLNDASDLSGFLAEHFANNNGKHLGFVNSSGKHLGLAGNSGKPVGFSVAAVHGGLKFGLSNPRRPTTSVTENPEPTGMILLGTGLAAIAGFARRRSRRRKDVSAR